MKFNRPYPSTNKTQRGVALLELLIALVVLAFGLLGLLPLIVASVGTNTNNRLDTNAILLAQSISEHIAGQPASSGAPLQLTDCFGNVWTIATAGAPAPGAGALLFTPASAPAPSLVDSVDFINQNAGAVPVGYQANFRTCNANGILTTYDVRWNIRTLPGGLTKLLTVAARPRLNAGQKINVQFSIPVSLRTVVGQVP